MAAIFMGHFPSGIIPTPASDNEPRYGRSVRHAQAIASGKVYPQSRPASDAAGRIRALPRGYASSNGLRIADVIAFADFNAVMAQDIAGSVLTGEQLCALRPAELLGKAHGQLLPQRG